MKNDKLIIATSRDELIAIISGVYVRNTSVDEAVVKIRDRSVPVQPDYKTIYFDMKTLADEAIVLADEYAGGESETCEALKIRFDAIDNQQPF